MLWRHLCRVRALSAAGLLSCSLFGAVAPARAEPAEPTPRADAAATDAVSILDARKAGDLTVEVRGAGQDRVKMRLKNTSGKRLKVVLPPGLVASSAAGQARGGFQSMGLGSASNRPGSFGAFQSTDSGGPGFRAVDIKKGDTADAVTVPADMTVEMTVVSVCLNFGIRTPGMNDRFELVDVDDYTTDPRARKALRSLTTYGTGHGVAQAVMWRVCNDVPFGAMTQEPSRVINVREVALAARFVEALDASGSSDLVDPAYLTEGRLFVRVVADGALATEARRLAREIEGMRVLGLPIRSLDSQEDGAASAPSVLLNVFLSAGSTGETRGRVLLSQAGDEGQWVALGKTSFTESSAVSVLDGAGLARALDRAVASAFVTVKTVRRTSGSTLVKVENRLPFTLANMTLKAGNSAGAPTVPFHGLGIAPSRSSLVPVQAPGATIDRVEMNGL